MSGQAPDGRALVTIRRAEACHSCAAAGACQALGGQTKDVVLVVENHLGAKVGDQVTLSMAESSVLKASAVLYLLPACGLIAGAIVGWKLSVPMGWGGDPASIMGSTLGLGLGLYLARVLSRKMTRSTRYVPNLTAIVSRAEPSD
jgi:sigma-E factor negative regulatory protein RseC